jgi:hypothetical protein
MLAVEGAMAVVLLAACAALVVRTIPRSPSPPTAPHIATLAADGHPGATLQVITGTPVLTIGVADLGATGTLLRVSTPATSPPPQLRAAGGGGNPVVYLSAPDAAAITVTLNAAVSWQLNLAGGTTRTVADLAGGLVAGIAVTKGSDVVDLTLPQPDGGVTVRLAAGASRLLLSLPGGVPVRVNAAAGAGEVSLEGRDHTAVAAGSVFTTPAWEPGVAGYLLDATAGAARITVTARPLRPDRYGPTVTARPLRPDHYGPTETTQPRRSGPASAIYLL